MQDKWEVEQKYMVEDPPKLRLALAQLGFSLIRIEDHADVYFRHPCRDFRASDEAFRLRRLDDQTWVTYKGKRLEAAVKTRPETELAVHTGDYEQWTYVLQQLGFSPLPAVCKKRSVYSNLAGSEEMREFVVTLDKVETLGDFAEIELLVDDQNQLESAAKKIAQIGAKLGLNNVEHRSYLSQLLRKLKIE